MLLLIASSAGAVVADAAVSKLRWAQLAPTTYMSRRPTCLAPRSSGPITLPFYRQEQLPCGSFRFCHVSRRLHRLARPDRL